VKDVEVERELRVVKSTKELYLRAHLDLMTSYQCGSSPASGFSHAETPVLPSIEPEAHQHHNLLFILPLISLILLAFTQITPIEK